MASVPTQNVWIPRFQSHREMTMEEIEVDKYYRNIRSILNKITPQKFKKLLHSLTNLDIDTDFKMEKLAEFIIVKAVDEPLYGKVYARMCSYLINHMKEKNSTRSVDCFKKFLLDGCQKFFMNIIDCQEDANAPGSESWYKEFANRQEMFGSVMFIGELYKTKVMPGIAMHDYVMLLLRKENTRKLEFKLECLYKLLRTIGFHYENEMQKKEEMDAYFTEIERLRNHHIFCSRVKFALLDLCELRANNWCDRRTREVPTTIDQIHSQHGG